MSISEHMSTFAGRRVCWYRRDGTLSTTAPQPWGWHPRADLRTATITPEAPEADPSRIAYGLLGLELKSDEELGLIGLIDRFAEDPAIGLVEALVLGYWGNRVTSSAAVVETLVSARERFAGLKALFLGDIVEDEQELSWIHQSNLSPLLDAYPSLEVLGLRGGTDLSFGDGGKHESLRELRVESGGIPEEALRSLWKWDLPNLEKLVLWLGEENYGGIDSVLPLRGLLSGGIFPKLRYLGLCNSEIADTVAEMLAKTSILQRIDVLDLSLGALSDRGVRALMAAPATRKLTRFDMTHHFASLEVIEELRGLGIEVIAEEPQEPEEFPTIADVEPEIYRYIAHSE